MAPKPRSTASPTLRISAIYRIYFLYLEPLMALGGVFLCFLQPQRLLEATVPVPALALTAEISPLTLMLITNIGSMYALFTVVEGVVLRVTKERAVWLAVIFGMVLGDLGHLYAVYTIAPSRAAAFASWNSDEWVNYGTLTLGLTLRLAFLMGIGRV